MVSGGCLQLWGDSLLGIYSALLADCKLLFLDEQSELEKRQKGN